MSPIITALQIVGDSEIEISFENGLQGWIDFADIIYFEAEFSNLKDPEYFATAKIDNRQDTISWKNGEYIESSILFNKVLDNYSRLFPLKEKIPQPTKNSVLYKIVKIEHFIDMCTNQYLYFNNVTSYEDDIQDSDMPDPEKELRKGLPFEKNPEKNLYDVFDMPTRKNTYACCFTLKESRYIWKHYAKDRKKYICLVFSIERLENYFRRTYIKSYFLNSNKNRSADFYINCGLVEYVNFTNKLTEHYHKNIYDYAFHKRKAYKKEQEFRITLNPFSHFQIEECEFLKLSCDWNLLVSIGALIQIKSNDGLTLRWLVRKITGE